MAAMDWNGNSSRPEGTSRRRLESNPSGPILPDRSLPKRFLNPKASDIVLTACGVSLGARAQKNLGCEVRHG